MKVLIADDEVLVRIGVRTSVDWNALGLQLVGEASDGCSALELAEKEKPDIVITDIKMPGMDGISLIKTLKKKYPEICIIVLSGYDDLELVKGALKAGAYDYILKLSLEESGLMNILTQVKAELEMNGAEDKVQNDRGKQENVSTVSENYDSLLYSLVKYSEKIILSQIDPVSSFEWAFDFSVKKRIVYLKVENERQIDERLLGKDREKYFESVTQVIRQTMLSNQKYEIIRTEPYEWVLLLSAGLDERAVIKLCEMLEDSLRLYFDISAVFGISREFGDIGSCTEHFLRAKNCVEEKYFDPQRWIFLEKDRGDFSENRVQFFSKEKEERLLQLLELAEQERILELLEEIFENIEKSRTISIDAAQDAIREILFIFVRFMKTRGGYDQILYESESIYKKLESMQTFSDVKNWCYEMVEMICSRTREVMWQEGNLEIQKVKEYIQEHITDVITLGELAEHVNMNEAYLSSRFSKKMGISITRYITEKRINLAKKYLKTTSSRIYEIGMMVGYDNEHYFSRIFKKITGVTPVEYRKLGDTEEVFQKKE